MNIKHCPHHGFYSGGFDICPNCEEAATQFIQRVTKREKRAKSRRKQAEGTKIQKRAKSRDFDSLTEERRYKYLSMLQQAGVIAGLETQPMFTLIPRLVIPANGVRGGYTQRAEVYTADFRYTCNGMVFVEDVKGAKRTKAGKITPYIKTPSASNKVKALMRIWANQGIHETHTFLFTVEHGGTWHYFNSNKTMIEFELSNYYEGIAA